MLAHAVNTAVLASGLVAPVSAHRSAVNWFGRRNKTADGLAAFAVWFAADCSGRARPLTLRCFTAAPLGLLVIAAQKAHELALCKNIRKRLLCHLLPARVFVVAVLSEALAFAARLRAQAPYHARCAKKVTAAEQMQCIAVAVAHFPHQTLVIVKHSCSCTIVAFTLTGTFGCTRVGSGRLVIKRPGESHGNRGGSIGGAARLHAGCCAQLDVIAIVTAGAPKAFVGRVVHLTKCSCRTSWLRS